MGSDMYLTPPPAPVFVLITNTAGKGAIYRYQAERSQNWTLMQRLGPLESKHVAKAFAAIHLQAEMTLTSNELPDAMPNDTMREILRRRSEEERRERQHAAQREEDLATLKRLREQYPDA